MWILTGKLVVLESNLVGYGVIVRIGANLALIPILGSIFDIIGLAFANLISLVLVTIYLVIIYKKLQNSEKDHKRNPSF